MTERSMEEIAAEVEEMVKAGLLERVYEHGEWRYRLTINGRKAADESAKFRGER